MGRAGPAVMRGETRETVLCPYCGVPLFTGRDRDEHLVMKLCRHEGVGEWDCADWTDPHGCACGAARRAG